MQFVRGHCQTLRVSNYSEYTSLQILAENAGTLLSTKSWDTLHHRGSCHRYCHLEAEGILWRPHCRPHGFLQILSGFV